MKLVIVALFTLIIGFFGGYLYSQESISNAIDKSIQIGLESDLNLYMRIASSLREGEVDMVEKYVGALAMSTASQLNLIVVLKSEIPQVLVDFNDTSHLLKKP